MSFTRREFLMGCSAAIAAMSGARVGQMVFADPAQAAATDEILVVVFLRGGCDGLTMLAPYDDLLYRNPRGDLAVPVYNPDPTIINNGALRIDIPNNPSYAGTAFGLNYKMPEIRELYQAGHLAMVHACGLKTDDTRSHFDAMDYIERGTPGEKTTSSGWITRHLQTSSAPGGFLPVMSSGSSVPASLLNYGNAVAVGNLRDFGIDGVWRYTRSQENNPMFQTIKAMYPGEGLNMMDQAGKRTIETIEAVQRADVGNYTPRGGVTYPNNSLANALKTVAQTAKLPDMALRIATVDFGGWDTHDAQANRDGTGYLPDRLGQISQALYAFYNDMVDFHGRLTVMVLSEFGRRLGTNASRGTDHGHGGVMLLLGGNVNGGTVYGQWPGLAQLDKNQDLMITTDFRTVMSEILLKRLGNTELGTIFPGFTAGEYGGGLGILNGTAPGAINWNDEGNLRLDQADELPNKLYLPFLAKC